MPAFGPRALSAFSAAKAESLLRDRLPCLGCHRLGREGGRIGPDLTAVGARRTPAFIAAVIRDPQSVIPGTIMPRIPMPPEWVELIASFLAGMDGDAGTKGAGTRPTATTPPQTRGVLAPAEPPAFAAPVVAGRGVGDPVGKEPRDRAVAGPMAVATPRAPGVGAARLYGRYCAACHGPEGGGDGFNAPFLPVQPTAHSDRTYMSTRSDDALFDAIFAGGRVMGRSHRMPAFGRTLERSQIRALVRYLRDLCGCEGPAWSRRWAS